MMGIKMSHILREICVAMINMFLIKKVSPKMQWCKHSGSKLEA